MYFSPKNDTIKTFLHNPFFEVRIRGLKICKNDLNIIYLELIGDLISGKKSFLR